MNSDAKEDLGVEVQITPEDVERAKAAARRDGSPRLNAMLNAAETGEATKRHLDNYPPGEPQ